MVYYILKKYYTKKPILYFYHSYKNNYFIPVKNLKKANKSLRAHFYTQFQIIGFMVPLRYIFMIINGIKLPVLFGEAVRKVSFTKEDYSINNFKNRFFYTLFSLPKNFQAPNERKDS